MKKKLYGIGALAATAAPIAAVVSCGGAGITSAMGIKLSTSNNAKLWFVADGGSVQDKSFNESGLAAVADFGNKNTKTYNFFQPKGGNIKAGYEQAARNGADLVLGTGFAHGDSFGDAGAEAGPAASFFNTAASPSFIGVDAEYSKGTAAQVTKLSSILFNTQYAGYLAGLYAIKYVETHQTEFDADADASHNHQYKVATYGGVAYPSVTSWMDGFHAAIATYGAHDQHKVTGDTTGTGSAGTADVIMTYVNGSSASSMDFSDGFTTDGDPGTHANEMSQKLLDHGADIIFPVAGPQIQNTLKKIKANNSKAKVIGVDGDQRKVLGDSRVIGSALKKLQEASFNAIEAFYKADKTDWNTKYAGKVFVGSIGFVFGESSSEFTGYTNYKTDVDTYFTDDSHKVYYQAAKAHSPNTTFPWSKISNKTITLS